MSESCRWDQDDEGHFTTQCGADGIRFSRGGPESFPVCPYCGWRILTGTRNVIAFANDAAGEPKL
jgi:DNA-directed RNA polymerase subunit RPC12/RpoP